MLKKIRRVNCEGCHAGHDGFCVLDTPLAFSQSAAPYVVSKEIVVLTASLCSNLTPESPASTTSSPPSSLPSPFRLPSTPLARTRETFRMTLGLAKPDRDSHRMPSAEKCKGVHDHYVQITPILQRQETWSQCPYIFGTLPLRSANHTPNGNKISSRSMTVF